jgi:hypothetical protein
MHIVVIVFLLIGFVALARQIKKDYPEAMGPVAWIATGIGALLLIRFVAFG